MKNIGSQLLGDAEIFSFERRIFNFAMLLGITMTFFGTAMDIYYKANIWADLFFLLLWSIMYYFARFKDHFAIVSITASCIFVFIFIPVVWISSGGSKGILPYYTIVFIAIIAIILKGIFRLVMIGSMFVIELLLLLHDAYHAGSLILDFQSRMNLIDFSMHILVIMAGMAIIMIVYSNTYMKEKERKENYAKNLEEYYLQQLYYMENLEEVIFKLKSERHDFNNHLGVVYGLLQNNDIAKSKKYTAKLIKTADEYRNIVNIPYSMLRAILNYKLSVAKENGIPLKLFINVPANLHLNEFDLTVIIGNLLDNAIEACLLLDNKGYIELSLFFKPDYLIIQSENPIRNGDEADLGKKRTNKADAENHGFGLNNIEFLVNKHNGLININAQNNTYKVNIAVLVSERVKI